jgi:hypothetical protein
MSERHRHPDDVVPTQPDDDERGPVEYLRVVVDQQLMPNVDLDADAPSGYETEQSDLFLSERFSGAGEPRRVELRLRHPDSTESHVSPTYSLREMDAFLRGMVRGERGEIDAKADHVGDDEREA